jgi:hypothetical protein
VRTGFGPIPPIHDHRLTGLTPGINIEVNLPVTLQPAQYEKVALLLPSAF